MEASGRNLTPDRLPVGEQGALFAVCDEALRRTVAYLRPRYLVGVGAFAAERARRALAGSQITIGTILHPSPANPLANRGWATHARRQLAGLGIALPAT
jgi:single-strand selective monofunctional uracil DNA glycosylase